MVHAEKIVTAVQRGTVNTRWRDFGNVWTLSGKHPADADQLRTAIARVADHRNTELSPQRELLQGFSAMVHAKWTASRRKQKLDHLPRPVECEGSCLPNGTTRRCSSSPEACHSVRR